jgi:hypothetical protein
MTHINVHLSISFIDNWMRGSTPPLTSPLPSPPPPPPPPNPLCFAAAVALTAGFTDGTGQIWLDQVQCSGTENRLIDCPSRGLGVHNCVHSSDAGVRCTGSATCTQGDIRLQGGTTTVGRVEICNNNVWGTVCDDSWEDEDARIACAQLGLPSSGESMETAYLEVILHGQ